MKKLVILLFVISPVTASALTDNYPKNEHIDVLHYRFQLQLQDTSNSITGKTTISLLFSGEVDQFYIDLVGPAHNGSGMLVTEVREDSIPVRFNHAEKRVHIIPTKSATRGETRSYTIAYTGIPADGLIIADNKYGERTFFGDNWPDRARYWLPCIDHPSDKATCEFVIYAPDHYQVVANGRLVETTNVDDSTRLTHWRTLVPLPTKVMVVGVGRFAVQYLGEASAVPVQSWIYPQDRIEGFFDYAMAESLVAFFSELIGPFPYAKLANVQSKTRYGGMENAGAIFYSERSVRGDRSNEGLLAHEIAHQWFGDAISEADWHHIWLSEGFATYFTHVYYERNYGEERLKQRLQRDRRRIIDYYHRNPRASVVDTTITELNRLLNTNSYQKGGWCVHMLRCLVGEDNFWHSIRSYYRDYQHTSILTDTFQEAVEKNYGRDLSWFFQQWLYDAGIPELSGYWRYNEKNKRLTIHLEQCNEQLFRIFPEIGIVSAEKESGRIEQLSLANRRDTYTFSLNAKPERVLLDPRTRLLYEGEFEEKK